MPLVAMDVAPYITRVQDKAPQLDAVVCILLGPSAPQWIKAWNEYGLKGKLPLLTLGETVNETYLRSVGDAALGVVSWLSYSPVLDTGENKRFVQAFNKKFRKDPVYNNHLGYLAAKASGEAMKAVNANEEHHTVVQERPMHGHLLVRVRDGKVVEPDELHSACHQGARRLDGERDEIRLEFAQLEQLGVARLEQDARRPVEKNRVHVGLGDEPVGVDGVHQRGADESLERHRIDPGPVGHEMERRVDMRAGVNAHGEGGGVCVVAPTHPPALVNLERRRDDPADRVGREIERDVVVPHASLP